MIKNGHGIDFVQGACYNQLIITILGGNYDQQRFKIYKQRY